MSDPTGDDTQCYPRKHIGVVSLTRNECPAIFESHTLKRTSTGKDRSALDVGRKAELELGDRFGSVMVVYSYLINVGPISTLS